MNIWFHHIARVGDDNGGGCAWTVEPKFLLLLVTVLLEEGGERHFSRGWALQSSAYMDSSSAYSTGSNLSVVSSILADGKKKKKAFHEPQEAVSAVWKSLLGHTAQSQI